jgi:hypothetical protein
MLNNYVLGFGVALWTSVKTLKIRALDCFPVGLILADKLLEASIVIRMIVQAACVLFAIEDFVAFWTRTRHQLLIYHLAAH